MRGIWKCWLQGVRQAREIAAQVPLAHLFAGEVARGNTNAPTIAIAERAADLIRGNTPLAPADLQVEPATASPS